MNPLHAQVNTDTFTKTLLRKTRPTLGTVLANLKLLWFKHVLWRFRPPSYHLPCPEPLTPEDYREPNDFPDLSHIRYEEGIHLTTEQALDARLAKSNINPAWIEAGPDADVDWFYHRDAFEKLDI